MIVKHKMSSPRLYQKPMSGMSVGKPQINMIDKLLYPCSLPNHKSIAFSSLCCLCDFTLHLMSWNIKTTQSYILDCH